MGDELKKLTHFDGAGNAIMVDVGDKKVTRREAVATGNIREQRGVGGRVNEP